MSEYSVEEKLKCVERELRQRTKVYRRLVHIGRMSKLDAEREIETMAAIAEDYRKQVGDGPLLTRP